MRLRPAAHCARCCAAVIAAVLFAACTPGAPAPPLGAESSTGAPAFSIDVNLTLHSAATALAQGPSIGYAPPLATIAAGSTLRFVNSDGFAHTASVLAGTSFGNAPPPSLAAEVQVGARLSDVWSSGTLGAGASSQTLIADRPGTYIYGCFFHPAMRGAIVVR